MILHEPTLQEGDEHVLGRDLGAVRAPPKAPNFGLSRPPTAYPPVRKIRSALRTYRGTAEAAYHLEYAAKVCPS